MTNETDIKISFREYVKAIKEAAQDFLDDDLPREAFWTYLQELTDEAKHAPDSTEPDQPEPQYTDLAAEDAVGIDINVVRHWMKKHPNLTAEQVIDLMTKDT